MASERQPGANPLLNCADCSAPVRKTASGTYVCTGCGETIDI